VEGDKEVGEEGESWASLLRRINSREENMRSSSVKLASVDAAVSSARERGFMPADESSNVREVVREEETALVL
jgi:hypothetical protein